MLVLSNVSIGRILGGILLISCTTIGGGVLALPTNTVFGGFFFTCLTFFICWFFSTCSALYLLEVTLWSDKQTNLISMAKSTLGIYGQIIAWVTYMLLLYALISAYLKASNGWFLSLLSQYGEIRLSETISLPLLATIIGIIIFLGTAVADYFNRLLSVGLIISYAVLVTICLPKVDVNTIVNLPSNIMSVPATISLIITTFGFSIVIPSLTHYFDRNVKSLLCAVIIGSLIPLIIYLIWEYAMLGILSIPGPHGLVELAKVEADGTQVGLALEQVLKNPILSISAKGFSIFAVLTSFIGVSLSLFHFLADGLQFSQKGSAGFKLFLLTFIPPICIVLFYPEGFDKILSIGGIFVSILLGILPVVMVWRGRYRYNKSTGFRLVGGKFLLVLTGLFFSYVVLQELVLCTS